MTVLPDAVVIEIGAPAAAAKAAYERLLGTEAADSPVPTFTRPGCELRLTGSGEDRVLFGVDDIDAAVQLLRRRGWQLEHRSDGTYAAAGLPLGLFQVPDASLDGPRAGSDEVGVHGIGRLDHLVFTIGNRDAAVALFGAELGLDFRLDRQLTPGMRQLFFRSGPLVIEVVVATPAADAAPDTLSRSPLGFWGIAWHTTTIDATHTRLTAAGAECSPVRDGRKPGTRIFTLRDHALGQRTVIIEQQQPVPTP